MSKDALTVNETQEMIIYIADGIIRSVDILTEADHMGDADHGDGMGRGFAAIKGHLSSEKINAIDSLFKIAGMEIMTKCGGAAGAVFGTLFRSGGAALENQTEFTTQSLADFMSEGLVSVKKRGKSDEGDKTMIDALAPAARKALALTDLPLYEALPFIAASAEEGMEKTKEMIATVGKAKTLGERSKGHPDPGAVSVSLILKFMNEYVEQL